MTLTWKITGFSFAALLLAGTAILWTYHLDLSRLIAIRLLDRSGLGPVTLMVDRVNMSELRAHDISLYGGSIRIADLALTYSPLRLVTGVLDRAEISGLQMTMVKAGDDITVGGVPFRSATSTGGGAAIGGFKIDAIRIAGAHVAFESSGGRLEATFSTGFALSGAGIRNASVAADVTLLVTGTAQSTHIVVPDFAVLPEGSGGMRLRFDKVTIGPKDLPWTVVDLGGEIVWGVDRLVARIGSGRVTSTRSPPALVPLEISGDAAMTASRIDFALHVEGEAFGKNAKFGMQATGSHDRTSGSGAATVTVAPVMFRVGGVQPRDFVPVLGDALPHLTGSVALAGGVTWRGTSVSPALILRLADGALEPQGARFSQIHGDIEVTGFWPVTTAPGQVLNGVVEAGGLVPADATLTFHLLPKPALSIESIQMDFAGGQITASPFIIDPARPNFETVIGLKQIDLDAALKLISVNGLSGSGHIDGGIPLAISGGKVVLREGKLAASGPGVLQLRSDVLPKQIIDAGDSMTLALQALSDFHYDILTMDLAESPTGNGRIALKIQGRNPAVLDGRPFNLNITLESNFDRLIDIVYRSMTVTQELLRRTTGSTQQ